MPDAMSSNDDTTIDTSAAMLEEINRFNTILARIDKLANRIDTLETVLLAAQQDHTQVLRTVMVGWNAFLKSAEAQLRTLFKGSIPPPIMKRLLQAAFKGLDETEKKAR